MKITKPFYYDSFRCIASACPDSCCHEWSVSVDPATAARYRALTGPLGEALRRVLVEEDGDTVMTIRDGRCPMWRTDGLCRIQAELGHDALCKTCREFPRLTHDYGDFQEWGLELSCPEAARLILSSPSLPAVVTEICGGAEPEYDEEAMALLLRTRPIALSLLEQARPIGEILVQLLMYGYHVQAELDGAPPAPFHPETALAEARSIAGTGEPENMLSFYRSLEILTERWKHRLDAPAYGHWNGPYLALARYFIERYWLQAVSDYDLVCRVKFTVISCLTINILGGDLLTTAQLYSKEIENDPENMEALLDAAYTGRAFTDDKLLGLLLG